MRGRLVNILVLALLLAGCRQAAVDQARLVALDSLIAVSPDSAAALLEAYPDDSLRTAGDRAYRALLLTQARYKAYIPATGDSLISMAVEHYADGHDPDKRTRSLLYKGCVLEEMSRLDSAMYCYKAAEDCATRSGDTYHRGYALMREASLYHDLYEFPRAISLYRMALECFQTTRHDRLGLQVLCAISSLYVTSEPDSAMLFAQKAMQMSDRMDATDFDYCSKTLADVHFVKEEYETCIRHAENAIYSTRDRQVYFHCHQLLAQAFCHLGATDSAGYYLAASPAPADKEDSVMFLTTLSVIAGASNNESKANELHSIVSNMADTIVINSPVRQLENAVLDYQTSTMEHRHSVAMTKLRWGIAALVILLAVAGALFRHNRTALDRRAQALAKELDKRIREIYEQRRSNSALRHTNETLDGANQRLQMQLEKLSSELDSTEEELLRQRNANQTLTSDIDSLKVANAQLSRQMEQKQLLLRRTDIELSQLKQSIRRLESSAEGRGTDEIESYRETAERIGKLVAEITRQAAERVREVNDGSRSQMQVKAKMREYFDRDYCQRLIMLVDAIYPDLMSNIGHAIEPLSAEEVMLACMHFLNFPNKVIGAYLGYTSKFSISHKKSEVAAKVLGENAKIQQLAMPR